MINQESTITLSVRDTGTIAEPAFLFHVLADGETLAANQSLSPDHSKFVRDFSRRFNSLFEQRYAPLVAEENLKALGSQLFDLWLAGSWDKVAAKSLNRARRLFIVASDSPDVLNLPWELARPTGDEYLGFDAKYSIRRLPWADRSPAEFKGQLPPRPLRVLFMACSPQDQHLLDYEREEESLLRALAGAGPGVAFDSGDLGSFEELRRRINDFEPHVVHLNGHGIVRDGMGYFFFEDERGQSDMRSSEEIRRQLFAGSSVQCAFIIGCQTGKAPPVAAMGGICQGLVSEEVPMAIGWSASIADDIAIHFATVFYNTLASGQTVDRALSQARHSIRNMCDERGKPSWTLPVLYSATTQGPVFDNDPKRPIAPPPRLSMVQQPLEGMSEGYTEHFVGRRRELQRLLPALREGRYQTVLITGLGGAGKSTLATRLARKLETDGFKLIPVPSSETVPLTVSRLLQNCGDAFLAVGLRDAHKMLEDADLSVDARLRYIVSAMNTGRFVLVLDNFEVNLDETSRKILDKEIAGFYTHLLTHLAGGSRAVITCRYQPADVPELPRTAIEESLGDFPESAFLKFLLREPDVERRYHNGDLPHDLLIEIHGLFGGTPRFLDQIRKTLKTIKVSVLREELKAVRLPSEDEPGALRKARDSYCEEIFTSRLYGYLSAESQKGLSRVAVYGVPVNLAGLAAVTGESIEKMRGDTAQWQDYALAYPEREKAKEELWTVYGLLRGWLLEEMRLSMDERRAAHKSAGDFLRDLERQDREGELGLSWVDCLMEARAQYLAASEYAPAREVTDRISGSLLRRNLYAELIRVNGELLSYEEHPGPLSWIGRAYLDLADYPAAREWYQRSLTAAGDEVSKESAKAWHGLATIEVNVGDYEAAREKFQRSLEINQQIGDRAGEAATWHQLATIDLNVGDYEAAREKFEKALAMLQQIGDRAGEAATLHQLATIDLRVGDYEAAREKFEKALAMRQQIGDRAGEAATFYQLGSLAAQLGRLAEGARLVALCYLIDQAIGHGDTESDFKTLSRMASQLNYSQEQFTEMLGQVAESYKADRGVGLLKAAIAQG